MTVHPTSSETSDPALSTDANDTASADTSGLSIISDSSQPEPLVPASVNSDNTPESVNETIPPADGTPQGPPIAARTSQTAADYSRINPDTGSIWTFDELMLVLKPELKERNMKEGLQSANRTKSQLSQQLRDKWVPPPTKRQLGLAKRQKKRQHKKENKRKRLAAEALNPGALDKSQVGTVPQQPMSDNTQQVGAVPRQSWSDKTPAKSELDADEAEEFWNGLVDSADPGASSTSERSSHASHHRSAVGQSTSGRPAGSSQRTKANRASPSKSSSIFGKRRGPHNSFALDDHINPGSAQRQPGLSFVFDRNGNSGSKMSSGGHWLGRGQKASRNSSGSSKSRDTGRVPTPHGDKDPGRKPSSGKGPKSGQGRGKF